VANVTVGSSAVASLSSVLASAPGDRNGLCIWGNADLRLFHYVTFKSRIEYDTTIYRQNEAEVVLRGQAKSVLSNE
jgi:hypothetical protein